MGDRVQRDLTARRSFCSTTIPRLVVGPGSTLLIEAFAPERQHEHGQQFSVNALRGSFRFITGDSPKPSYAIKTPTATIGIRGTEFDLSVRPQRADELHVCSAAQPPFAAEASASQAVSACTMIEVPPGGAPKDGDVPG